MPARKLPLLTNESNVHEYQNDLFTRSGYAYGRPRESSRGTAGSLPAVDKASSQHPVHLPSVNTGSATSTRGQTDNAAGDGQVQSWSPDSALERFSRQMSSYEQREIYNYQNVYFIGLNAVKRPGVAGAPNNDGFDDEHGSYIQVATICILHSVNQSINLLMLMQQYDGYEQIPEQKETLTDTEADKVCTDN